jgi:hypothetical protein
MDETRIHTKFLWGDLLEKSHSETHKSVGDTRNMICAEERELYGSGSELDPNAALNLQIPTQCYQLHFCDIL